MSQAFKCDICGDCVDNEADAYSEWEIAREQTTINTVPVDLYIKVGADVPHLNQACRNLLLAKVKAWVAANL